MFPCAVRFICACHVYSPLLPSRLPSSPILFRSPLPLLLLPLPPTTSTTRPLLLPLPLRSSSNRRLHPAPSLPFHTRIPHDHVLILSLLFLVFHRHGSHPLPQRAQHLHEPRDFGRLAGLVLEGDAAGGVVGFQDEVAAGGFWGLRGFWGLWLLRSRLGF